MTQRRQDGRTFATIFARTTVFMLKRRAYIVLFIGLPLLGLAQTTATINGRVSSAATGEALIGAYVALLATDYRTVTDETGAFNLTDLPLGNYTMRITYLGKTPYETTLTLSTAAQVMTISLTDAPANLNAVVVQGTGTNSMGLTRLRGVEGVAIYEGKKSEVVLLDGLTANLATNNPRQVYARIAGLNIWESDGAGLQLGIGGADSALTAPVILIPAKTVTILAPMR